jgi:tRNA(Ile2) C34 agmatinyltransferase TiaS
MTTLIVLAALGVAVYLLLVRVSPLHRCPRCKGKRVAAGRRGLVACPRCKGTAKARRAGARLVHRAAGSRRDGAR